MIKKQLIKIEVDFYADTFRNGIVNIPVKIANDLKGSDNKSTWWTRRDGKYWKAIDYIRGIIDRELYGWTFGNKDYIHIISIRKYQNNN